MHFLTFVSTILATAVLVASEPSAQLNSFEIAAADFGTLSPDPSYEGDLAGKPPSLEPGAVPVGATPVPATGRTNAPAPRPEAGQSPQEVVPGTPEQQAPPSTNPYGRQQQSSPSNNPYEGQQRNAPDGLTSPPAGYRGDQHCRQFGGCPFECHTDCVCWEWCKNANCNLALSGEQALTSAQISCDPSAGEKFIGNQCRPYCANWCEDIKNQIVQVLPTEQAQKAFLSKPLECDKNFYNCPGGPNPTGLDCLTPTNPLDPGTGGSRQSPYDTPQRQQPQQLQQPGAPPNFSVPPGFNSKELDKADAESTTEFPVQESWRK